MNRQIFYVEDDDVIRENYSELLQQSGFNVTACATKAEAMRAFEGPLPDLVLLDLTLGSERDAGFELCSYLRSRDKTLPIVFLTMHEEDFDKVAALRMGADDYLTKDSSMALLVVRIETLFRRIDAHREQREAAHRPGDGPFVIDAGRSELYLNGTLVPLTLTQFWMVSDLIAHQGQARSHDQLMHAASIHVEPNTVVAHIKSIREAIAAVAPEQSPIRTERGRGYRWMASP